MPVGTPVPTFSAVNQFGEHVGDTTLPGAAFLVFYPFAFSRVCTAELGVLQRNLSAFEDRGAAVLGVSVDHRFALRAYAAQEGLTFELLSDFWPHGEIARAFQCFDSQHGRAGRATYLLTNGHIADAFFSAPGEPRPWARYQQALASLPA
nr:redoxin domain-containing protein [Zhihengliuella flava]